MKDRIDERNEREKISKSIIKYWNVNYVPAATANEEAQKVLDRLDQEAAQDEAERLDEIAAAKAEWEQKEEMYNAKTKSYSGKYGQQEVEDEVTKGQIDKILHEKSEALRSLIEQGGQE